MKSLVSTFIRDEDGATAIEYGMIAAGVAVAIMLTIFTLGDDLNTLFGNVQSQVASRN